MQENKDTNFKTISLINSRMRNQRRSKSLLPKLLFEVCLNSSNNHLGNKINCSFKKENVVKREKQNRIRLMAIEYDMMFLQR